MPSSPAASIAELFAFARATGVDRLDASVLLSHHMQQTRGWLIAHDDQRLAPEVTRRVKEHFDARARGVPLAYLVGHKEFRGIDLQVDAGVLVPRPETEGLVDWALEVLAATAHPEPLVVDLGTGSGAIALGIKLAWPQADVHAVDRSEAALDVARRNGERLGLAIRWHHGDWWQASGLDALLGRVHLVVSNPPYVRTTDEHLEALRHEPPEALIGGADGLDAIRTIIGTTPKYLAHRGALLLEHGHDQGDDVRALLQRHGFQDCELRRDLAGHGRCSGGHT